MMEIFEPSAVRLQGAVAGTGGFRLGPLDIEIPQGMVTAIVGRNGSGKSTLFRVLLGLEPLRQGQAKVLDSCVEPGGDESYKARVGFVSENPHAYQNAMTAAELAKFASLWYPDWDEGRYRRLLARFEIDAKAKLSRLSKGMRRKAELALAMAHDPELMLLDEPSSGLDPIIWKIWLDEMQSYIQSGGKTVLIATHVTEEVKRLADCVLFLHQGRSLGLYEKDRLFDEWRSVVVRERFSGGGNVRNLELLSGFCGMHEEAPGVYRLNVNAPASSQEAERWEAYGFQVLENRRLELEDILNCMIQKEAENVESA